MCFVFNFAFLFHYYYETIYIYFAQIPANENDFIYLFIHITHTRARADRTHTHICLYGGNREIFARGFSISAKTTITQILETHAQNNCACMWIGAFFLFALSMPPSPSLIFLTNHINNKIKGIFFGNFSAIFAVIFLGLHHFNINSNYQENIYIMVEAPRAKTAGKNKPNQTCAMKKVSCFNDDFKNMWKTVTLVIAPLSIYIYIYSIKFTVSHFLIFLSHSWCM